MQPISGLISGAAQSPVTVAGVTEPPKIQRLEDEALRRSLKRAMDEYVPEEKQEPAGRYWPGKDENGQPKIYFDDPTRAVDQLERPDELPNAGAPEQNKDAEGPDKKASGDKTESCTCSTGKVDREIEKLKKERAELERQINSETDDTKIKELEKKLSQIESELSQKDNDTYRHQHSTFSYTIISG